MVGALSFVSPSGTAGAGAERLGSVNRGAGKTGISLGTGGLGAGFDCDIGLGCLGLFTSVDFGATIGANRGVSVDEVSGESIRPVSVAGAVGGASVLGVIMGVSGCAGTVGVASIFAGGAGMFCTFCS